MMMDGKEIIFLNIPNKPQKRANMRDIKSIPPHERIKGICAILPAFIIQFNIHNHVRNPVMNQKMKEPKTPLLLVRTSNGIGKRRERGKMLYGGWERL